MREEEEGQKNNTLFRVLKDTVIFKNYIGSKQNKNLSIKHLAILFFPER
jgi:hypothetical protein